MNASAAAVVDLQEFRARRTMCAGKRPEQATSQGSARSVAPFWVVWVPVWPVR